MNRLNAITGAALAVGLLTCPSLAAAQLDFISEVDGGPEADEQREEQEAESSEKVQDEADAGPPEGDDAAADAGSKPAPSVFVEEAAPRTDPPVETRSDEATPVEREPPLGGWISKKRYVWGGVAGSVLSFGAGHMIAEEWTSFGWFYTTTQVLGTGMLIGGVFGEDAATVEIEELSEEGIDTTGMTDDEQKRKSDELSDRDMEAFAIGVAVSGAVILSLSYVAEKVDYWVRARRRLEPTGPVAPRPAIMCTGSESERCLTKREYVGAGLMGTFVGFGSGHLMTGETSRGVGFLVGEGICAAAIAVGALIFVDVIPLGEDALTGDAVGGFMYIGGAAGLVGLRIWEKVDVWKRPRHERVGARRHEAEPREVSLVPLVLPALGGDRAGGVVLGIGGSF